MSYMQKWTVALLVSRAQILYSQIAILDEIWKMGRQISTSRNIFRKITYTRFLFVAVV